MKNFCVLAFYATGLRWATAAVNDDASSMIQHTLGQSPDDRVMMKEEVPPRTYPGNPPSPAPEFEEDEEVSFTGMSFNENDGERHPTTKPWPRWSKQKKGLRTADTCEDWAQKTNGCNEDKMEFLRADALVRTELSADNCCININGDTSYKWSQLHPTINEGIRENKTQGMPPWIPMAGYWLVSGNNVNPDELQMQGVYSKFENEDNHMNWDQAMLTSLPMAKHLCFKAPSCFGFSHKGSTEDAFKNGKVWVYFKTKNLLGWDWTAKAGEWPKWTSYAVQKDVLWRAPKDYFLFKTRQDRNPPPHP